MEGSGGSNQRHCDQVWFVVTCTILPMLDASGLFDLMEIGALKIVILSHLKSTNCHS